MRQIIVAYREYKTNMQFSFFVEFLSYTKLLYQNALFIANLIKIECKIRNDKANQDLKKPMEAPILNILKDITHTGKCLRRFGGINAYCRYFIDRKW